MFNHHEKFYRSKVLFILFSKCKWMAFLLLESRLLDQCSFFILSFRDQNFVQSRLKLLIEIISILFCVFEVETLRYFLLFCLSQVKIYLLCRLFRLKFVNRISKFYLFPFSSTWKFPLSRNYSFYLISFFAIFYSIFFFPANF